MRMSALHLLSCPRLKDLNIKPKNDIIKEKIEELAKKYKIKFEQVKYPPEKRR